MLILRIIALTGLLCTVNCGGLLDSATGLLGGGGGGMLNSVVQQTSVVSQVAKDDAPADAEITKAAMDTVVKISDKAMIVKSKLTDAKSKAKKKNEKKKSKKATTAPTTTPEPDDDKDDEKDKDGTDD